MVNYISTLPGGYQLLLLASIMFYGFLYYGGLLKSWETMHIVPRLIAFIPMPAFFAADIAWNIGPGSVMYWDIPFQLSPTGSRWYHRQWTFSQRTEFWANESHNEWRRTWLLGGNNWKSLLNSMVNGHIG
jgi:hypothetical protein